jgi:hypothetical protein
MAAVGDERTGIRHPHSQSQSSAPLSTQNIANYMRTEIEQRFETESKMLPVLRERFTGQVARWVFSKAEILSDYGDIMRCCGSDMNSYSDVLSGPDDAVWAYGFDQSDRLIVIRLFESETVLEKTGSKEPALQEIPTSEVCAEEFISYHGDGLVDVARFVRGDLQAVRQLSFRDRLLVEEECFRDGCYLHTQFRYEERRMVLQHPSLKRGMCSMKLHLDHAMNRPSTKFGATEPVFNFISPFPRV